MSEIEKQFFETFEIEKINVGTFIPTGFQLDYVMVEKYPQITDSVLLKLICILTRFFKEVVLISSINKEDLKEQVLSIFIKTSYRDKFKHQVQALFNENN